MGGVERAWSTICFLGWICTYTDPAQHLTTAGSNLEHLARDLSDVRMLDSTLYIGQLLRQSTMVERERYTGGGTI